MTAGLDPSHRAYVAELAGRDERAGALLAELDALAVAVGALRRDADAVRETLARGPQRLEQAREAELETERELARQRETLARAEEERQRAEQARDGERLAAARRFEVRARDSVGIAGRRRDESRALREQLAAELAAAQQAAPRIVEEGQVLAGRLAAHERLASEAGVAASNLDGVVDWTVTARAALFVARGSVARERETVIREANELASVLLGEPVAGASVARVVERLAG